MTRLLRRSARTLTAHTNSLIFDPIPPLAAYAPTSTHPHPCASTHPRHAPMRLIPSEFHCIFFISQRRPYRACLVSLMGTLKLCEALCEWKSYVYSQLNPNHAIITPTITSTPSPPSPRSNPYPNSKHYSNPYPNPDHVPNPHPKPHTGPDPNPHSNPSHPPGQVFRGHAVPVRVHYR